MGWVGGGWVVVVAWRNLVSAPVPFGFRSYWDLVGVGPRGFGTKGLGTGLDNKAFLIINIFKYNYFQVFSLFIRNFNKYIFISC